MASQLCTWAETPVPHAQCIQCPRPVVRWEGTNSGVSCGVSKQRLAFIGTESPCSKVRESELGEEGRAATVIGSVCSLYFPAFWNVTAVSLPLVLPEPLAVLRFFQ